MFGRSVATHRRRFEVVEDAFSLVNDFDADATVFDGPADLVPRFDVEPLSDRRRNGDASAFADCRLVARSHIRSHAPGTDKSHVVVHDPPCDPPPHVRNRQIADPRPSLMDERFASALDDAFPEREPVGFAGDDPRLNDRNGTVPVTFADGGRVFCKLAVDGDGNRLAAERAAIEYVGANGDVPVPRVLACDPDATVPYLVTEPMDGRPLSHVKWDADRAGEAEAMRALGRTLATLHELRFDAHGEITGGGADGLAVHEKPWTDVFLDQIDVIGEMAHSDRYDRYVDDVVAAVDANRETLDAAPATLVHNDPHGSNAYRSEAGVGLLDWEFAHVGDPARGLHRVREQEFGLFRPDEPAHELDALREGYRERAGSLPEGHADRVPIYEVVRLLGASAFFEEKAASVDESRETVGAWMDAEMERRLAAIR